MKIIGQWNWKLGEWNSWKKNVKNSFIKKLVGIIKMLHVATCTGHVSNFSQSAFL